MTVAAELGRHGLGDVDDRTERGDDERHRRDDRARGGWGYNRRLVARTVRQRRERDRAGATGDAIRDRVSGRDRAGDPTLGAQLGREVAVRHGRALHARELLEIDLLLRDALHRGELRIDIVVARRSSTFGRLRLELGECSVCARRGLRRGGQRRRRPHGPHRHRVLTDRDADTERDRGLARGAHAGVEPGVLAGVPRGGHPVARQLDPRQLSDRRPREVRDRLGDREPRRGGGIEQRDRRTLADRHDLAGVCIEAGERERAIGDRDLEPTDHRIAGDHAADGTIADRDEERLVGHRRQAEHAMQGLRDRCGAEIELRARGRDGLGAAGHSWCLPEHDLERQIHRRRAARAIGDGEPTVRGGNAELRPRRALASTQRGELLHAHGIDREHVALLRLVAPQLER